MDQSTMLFPLVFSHQIEAGEQQKMVVSMIANLQTGQLSSFSVYCCFVGDYAILDQILDDSVITDSCLMSSCIRHI